MNYYNRYQNNEVNCWQTEDSRIFGSSGAGQVPQLGFPFFPPPQLPGQGLPPGQPPGFPPPGQHHGSSPGHSQGSSGTSPGQAGGPPTSPPPQFTPQVQQSGISLFAVDPGAIRGCLYRFTYVWLNNRDKFWFYPVFVGRNSVAGWRWRNFRWVYFGIDLNEINNFECY